MHNGNCPLYILTIYTSNVRFVEESENIVLDNLLYGPKIEDNLSKSFQLSEF